MNSFDELILKWREGSLSSEELRQINALLASAENRATLREEFLLSAGLRAVTAADGGKIIPMTPPPRRFPTAAWAAAIAACLVLGAVIARFAFAQPEVALLGPSGQRLNAGDLIETTEGEETVIQLDAGRSSIQVRGGSRLQIVSLGRQKQFRLHHGSVVANVAPQREPLLFFTPQAEARVLGTEFVLSALPRSTRLDVAHGKVRFKRVTDGRSLDVRENEFATISPELTFATRSMPPAPWRDKDIGAVAMHGVAFVDGGKCLIKGAGRNTCLKKDQLHYMYQKAQGDFEFRARLVSFSARSENARAGIMVRRDLKTACRQAFVSFRGDQHIEIRCRPDSDSQELFVTPASLPVWLRVTRHGGNFSFAISRDGDDWQELACETVEVGETAFTGLAVTSFNNEVLDESVFDNVSLISLGGR
jgi:ferric-dicitrate binding protein FerR (iron transport regulator)/regulation of enolase protein 1 (concanavalin A-like superfamily)